MSDEVKNKKIQRNERIFIASYLIFVIPGISLIVYELLDPTDLMLFMVMISVILYLIIAPVICSMCAMASEYILVKLFKLKSLFLQILLQGIIAFICCIPIIYNQSKGFQTEIFETLWINTVFFVLPTSLSAFVRWLLYDRKEKTLNSKL